MRWHIYFSIWFFGLFLIDCLSAITSVVNSDMTGLTLNILAALVCLLVGIHHIVLFKRKPIDRTEQMRLMMGVFEQEIDRRLYRTHRSPVNWKREGF